MIPKKKRSGSTNSDRMKTDKFCIGDYVEINGVVGHVDFIGEEVIVLLDDEEERHYIPISEISEVYLLRRFIEGNLCCFYMKGGEDQKKYRTQPVNVLLMFYSRQNKRG